MKAQTTIVVVLSLGLAAQSLGQSYWKVETADPSGCCYSNLKLDSEGAPHIAYTRGGGVGNSLWHVFKHGDGWTHELIAQSPYNWYIDDVDLTSDMAGFLHASFVLSEDDGDQDGYYFSCVKYANNTSGAWQVVWCECGSYSDGDYYGSSIAVDHEGHPGICFVFYGYTHPPGLILVRQSTSEPRLTWTREVVDGSFQSRAAPSLAFDGVGAPKISYFYPASSDLRFASRSDGAWAIETVDAPGAVGGHNSLALDAIGAPHIAYRYSTARDLKYAVRLSGGWSREVVDSTGDVGLYPSIQLGADGAPAIAYSTANSGTGTPRFASRVGGAWRIETIDPSGNLGWYTSLALDRAGIPHVSYNDAGLKHAALARWIAREKDESPEVAVTRGPFFEVSPNPFVHALTIRHGASEKETIRLSVLDASGRLVADLRSGAASGGTGSASWDGRGSDGRRAASGTYFVRLMTATRVETRRVVLLR